MDDDILEAARALMRASGKTLGQVLSQLARRGLQPRHDHDVEDGLPVFPVSAKAPIIPSDLASSMLADDQR